MSEKKYKNISSKDPLNWDPDYTKVTTEEAHKIEKAENSGFISEDEVDWDQIGVDD